MKRQIRRGVFETNSSSTHSITMCSEQEFEDWKDGKILFNKWNDAFVDETRIELDEHQKIYAKDEYESTKVKYQKDWNDLSKEEQNDYYVEYAKNHDLIDEEYQTYEEWKNDSYLEYYVDRYTSESGDKIVAFGKYGYDG